MKIIGVLLFVSAMIGLRFILNPTWYKRKEKMTYKTDKNGDLKAFFFGASPFGSTKHTQESNTDYDSGPEW